MNANFDQLGRTHHNRMVIPHRPHRHRLSLHDSSFDLVANSRLSDSAPDGCIYRDDFDTTPSNSSHRNILNNSNIADGCVDDDVPTRIAPENLCRDLSAYSSMTNSRTTHSKSTTKTKSRPSLKDSSGDCCLKYPVRQKSCSFFAAEDLDLDDTMMDSPINHNGNHKSSSNLNDTFHSTTSSSGAAMPLDLFLAGLTGQSRRRPVIVVDNASIDLNLSMHSNFSIISGDYDSESAGDDDDDLASHDDDDDDISAASPFLMMDIVGPCSSSLATSRWESSPSSAADDSPPSHPRWSMSSGCTNDRKMLMPQRDQSDHVRQEEGTAAATTAEDKAQEQTPLRSRMEPRVVVTTSRWSPSSPGINTMSPAKDDIDLCFLMNGEPEMATVKQGEASVAATSATAIFELRKQSFSRLCAVRGPCHHHPLPHRGKQLALRKGRGAPRRNKTFS